MFLGEKNDPSMRQAAHEPTLTGFIAFCESKPADERYAYIDAHHCAVAQFTGKALLTWQIKERFGEAAHAAVRDSYTFGELARRLRAL